MLTLKDAGISRKGIICQQKYLTLFLRISAQSYNFSYYIYKFLEIEPRQIKKYKFLGVLFPTFSITYKVSDFVSDQGKNVLTSSKECYLLLSFKGITFFSFLRV